MRSGAVSFASLYLVALLASCGASEGENTCVSSDDCESGERCVDGMCVAGTDGGPGVDAGSSDTDGGTSMLDGGATETDGGPTSADGGGADGGTATDGGPTRTDGGPTRTDGGPIGRTATLTVVVTGTGRGTIRSTPAGIICPGTCTASFPFGATVTLNQIAASTCPWLAPIECSATDDPCVLTMDMDQTARAFLPIRDGVCP